MKKNFQSNKPRPLLNLSLVDHVEHSLREYFSEENLQPGDAIPKEVELADAMGVSRTAIREALARLKTLGIVESRRNRGMILTHPDLLGNVKRVLDPMLLDSDTLNDIFELRLVLELGIADLLFLRKNEKNLEELENIVQREEKVDDLLAKTKLDVEFHSKLYDISGNVTILRFQKMLLPIFDYVYASNADIKDKKPIPKDAISHRELFECLKEGTSDEFRKKMKIHLDVYFNKIQ